MSAPRETQTRPNLSAFARLTICAVIVVAIAFGFAILGSDGAVPESHADVAWLSPFERSNTDRVLSALERLGHNDPARYNLNGNTVFFSTNTSRKSPREVMIEYQEEFRRQGLNDRIYLTMSPDEEDARNRTGLTGGLVPLALSDHQVILGGIVTRNRAQSDADLMENINRAQNPTDLFRAHRYIEITRSHDSRHTSIVASFSDEAFDYQRMQPGSEAPGQQFDPVLPPCPGCTRLTRFADDNPDQNERVDLAFIGPRSLDETRSFYLRTLSAQGWQSGGYDLSLDKIEALMDIPSASGEALTLTRDDRELTLAFLPDFETGETLTFATYTGR